MAARVTRLAIAPVKGLRVAPVPWLDLTPSGPRGDRAFLVVDHDDRLLRTTRNARLLQVAAAWDGSAGALTLRFPDGTAVSERPDPGPPAETTLYDGRSGSWRATRRRPGPTTSRSR